MKTHDPMRKQHAGTYMDSRRRILLGGVRTQDPSRIYVFDRPMIAVE